MVRIGAKSIQVEAAGISRSKREKMKTKETGLGRVWEKVADAGALLSVLAGAVSLLGWLAGLPLLNRLGDQWIPMAPSTAVLFILFGTVELLRRRDARGFLSGAEARGLSLSGLILSGVLLVISMSGIQSDLEHFPFGDPGLVAGISAGHMSPLTAFCFILAAISQLSLLSPRDSSPFRVRASFFSSLGLMLVSFLLITSYLLGEPLFYGGGIIPPALTTSLAFMMLAASLYRRASRSIGGLEEMEPGSDWGKGPFLFLILVLAAVAILVLSWLYFDGYGKRFREEATLQLSTTADLKVQELVQWRKERISDAEVFYQNREFGYLVNRVLLAPEDLEVKDRLLSWLRSVQEAYRYDRIALYDRAGREMLAFPPGTEAVGRHIIDELDETFSLGQIRFLDFHRHSSNGKPYLGLLVPVRIENEEGPIALLLMRIDPEQYLFPMISRWPTLSGSAETFLVRREDDHVLFLNNPRFLESSAMELKLPLEAGEEGSFPAGRAVLGKEGIIEGVDYRGVEVLAFIRSVPDSPWFMVAKMDLDEINAPLRERMWLIVILAGALILLTGAVIGAVWQRNIKIHYREIFRAESRYETTLNSIGDGVIVADTRGRVELMNPKAEAMTGWSQGEAAGLPLEEVFPICNEDTRVRVENPVEKVLKKGLVVGLANHTLLLSRDGREIPISDSGAPIHDQEGNITGVVVVFSDKTGERKVERELREREARYRSLTEHSPDAIFINHRDRVEFANESCLRLFGAEREELIGKPVYELFDSVCHEMIKKRIEKLREEPGPVPSVEEKIVRMDGKVVDVEVVAASFELDGELLIHVILRDITERKKHREEQRKMQEQLSQAQKMESVGRLAGGVAHDFNNMLSVIIGTAELAMERIGESDPLRGDLGRIHESAVRSADLTRQLLAFARKQAISPRVVDLNETLAGMLGMLRRLIGEDIELSWIPGKDLRPVKIDPAQLDQVLANLCINARDAIDGVGEVTIETGSVELSQEYCRQHEGSRPGSYVTLTVSDDGRGMEKEVLSRLFEPFYTTKQIGEGTGLGLATVYGIVRQNDGFINVYSEPGQGSTFRIYLPCYSGTSERPASKESAEKVAGGKETVLLVEDEEILLDLGRMMLDSLGYDVLTANSPGEALKIFRGEKDRIDLLVTDVVMPEMNGRDLAEQMRAECPGLRILFMSGYTANVIVHHGVLDQGVHFMEKPFSLETLSRKVREALDED